MKAEIKRNEKLNYIKPQDTPVGSLMTIVEGEFYGEILLHGLIGQEHIFIILAAKSGGLCLDGNCNYLVELLDEGDQVILTQNPVYKK